MYGGAHGGFSATKGAAGWVLADASGAEGKDLLSGIERIAFADTSLALDLDGVAGKAYRVYAAAFDRAPDLAGLGFWIDSMDKGASLLDVATGFTQSKEFRDMYGASPSTETFLSKLYDNILHRAPDQAGFDYWVQSMNGGLSQAEALAQFSESNENQAQVIGSIGNGISYALMG